MAVLRGGGKRFVIDCQLDARQQHWDHPLHVGIPTKRLYLPHRVPSSVSIYFSYQKCIRFPKLLGMRALFKWLCAFRHQIVLSNARFVVCVRISIPHWIITLSYPACLLLVIVFMTSCGCFNNNNETHIFEILPEGTEVLYFRKSRVIQLL